MELVGMKCRNDDTNKSDDVTIYVRVIVRGGIFFFQGCDLLEGDLTGMRAFDILLKNFGRTRAILLWREMSGGRL